MKRHLNALSFAVGVTLLAMAAASPAHAAGRVSPIKVKLTAKDKARLNRLALSHRQQIGPHQTSTGITGFTPVVDLHIAEASSQAGVRWKKLKDPRTGIKGPTVFEVEGIDKAGGELHMVLTGSASGHVMNPHWGGRPFAEVQRYASSDIVHLTHRAPGASRTEPVVTTKSQGFVTQEGFSIALKEKGTHDFFYFRTGGNGGGSGGEGSEPELRHVQIIVK
jgi:hypothetical protein